METNKDTHAINLATLKRLASCVLAYRAKVFVIIFAIIVSSIVQAACAMFLQSIVDVYILPLVGKHNPDWMPLVRMIILMASVYVIGAVSYTHLTLPTICSV